MNIIIYYFIYYILEEGRGPLQCSGLVLILHTHVLRQGESLVGLDVLVAYINVYVVSGVVRTGTEN